MKKKPKKTVKKKFKGPTLLDRLPNNHGEWLELVIANTKRHIHNPPMESENYLRNQLDRLTKELKEWRKNEGKN